jgi:anti-sigma factor RsiW
MRRLETCAAIQERLTFYVEGWLSPQEQERIAAHLAGCSECAAAWRQEQRLQKQLAQLPDALAQLPESPAPRTWAQARVAHTPRRAPRFSRQNLALAFSAGAAMLLLGFWLTRPIPPQVASTPPTTPAAETELDHFADAHLMVSAGDALGDPNRAMLLVFVSARSAGQSR